MFDPKDDEIALGEKIKAAFGEKDAEVYYRLMAERDCLAGDEDERMFKMAKARIRQFLDKAQPENEIDDSRIRELIRYYKSGIENVDDIVNSAVDEYCAAEGIYLV